MLELGGILVLGVLAQWLSYKVRLPAILPLILVGLAVGPFSTYITHDGTKLMDADRLFQGHFLFDFISLAVGIILFEGGLTLKFKELKQHAGVVRNLITLGALITVVGATATAYYVLDLEFRVALLFGSLVVVTGPTVIGPIIRNVRPNANIGTILKWEGVLIDPIGALIAIIVYEFIISGDSSLKFTPQAAGQFFSAIFSGFFVGVIFSFFIYQSIKRKLMPAFLRNVVILGMVVLAFSFADFLHKESGLFAVTLMGVILSNVKLGEIRHVLHFKEDISRILISVLFIMLSSRMEISDFEMLGTDSWIVFAILIFVIRPLAVFGCSFQSALSFKEKLFISWISPRGIVAAGVASIFSIRLLENPNSDILNAAEREAALYLLPLTFMVILGTVLLQGLTAKLVASILGVRKERPNGVLFVGANDSALYIAHYLQSVGIPVMMSDTSGSAIREARALHLPVFEGSLLVEGALDDAGADLSEYGQVWAMTSSAEINVLACNILKQEFGRQDVFRYVTKKELQMKTLHRPDNILFGGKVDFISLTKRLRENPLLQDKEFKSEKSFKEFMAKPPEGLTPLFALMPDEMVVPVTDRKMDYVKGMKLVYTQK